jgi:hypothetical protein
MMSGAPNASEAFALLRWKLYDVPGRLSGLPPLL